MLYKKRTSISLEAIKYQTDKKLYKALTGYFQMMRDTNTDQVEAFRSIQKELIRAVDYHKNMPIEFVIVNDADRDYTIAVLPPVFTEKHPLVTGQFKNTVSDKTKLGVFKELYHNPEHVLEFGVDYDTGKLTGFAGQLPSTIYIGRSLLNDGNIKAEGLATMLIHELGHIEGFYLSLRYATSSSWAVRFAIEMLDETHDANDFLVTAQKIGAVISAQDVARIAEIEDHAKKEMVTAIILDKFREKTRSEIGTGFADQTSNEALADQFMVRYGDPMAFVQVVEYILSQKKTDNDRLAWAAAIGQAAVLTIACGALAPLLGAGVAMAGVMISGLAANGVVMGNYGDQKALNTAYDKPYERVKRMRSELVGVVKETDNAVVRGQLLAEIKALDEVLPSLKKFDPVLEKIQLLFSGSLRKLRREQYALRSLEELFNNPLYLRHAQLSQINEIEG